MELPSNFSNLLHDYPQLYDQVIPDPEQAMGRFLHGLLAQFAPGPRLLDVGCGLGREIAYLQTQGYQPIGIDSSAAMIAWASQRNPSVRFVQASQQTFALDCTFDAIICVGSTLLYNLTNAELLGTLRRFRQHLVEGGVLVLDMRNAAFFLTEVGQRWLRQEHREETELANGTLVGLTRFDITPSTQILERYYTWLFLDQPPLHEHLQHRLLFPQELGLLLQLAGFGIEVMFDEPAPHIGAFAGDWTFGQSLFGRRLQVVARALPSSAQGATAWS
ncbi:class I SAM-dependent methyltransferase [Herpetosiphon giganteus]|uniref:class I SAM-dependent methyltransferase n=1 Tax=Herpetosiphon giganteus TaxID=2029754 RepID=UPI001959BB8A|nr:class I SAM-dependent methyltransferase [Herpetosiphon giganteus]MBM7843427.1 SAM-dependent methyltransferase [Herpetosiphon giganteus]